MVDSTPKNHSSGYRLVGLLASGGMARLFLATKEGIDGFRRVVLLKQVLPHLSDSKDLMQMFINEARLAARLDHPNIVRTYELSQLEEQYFISMEYLPAEDLTRILRRSKQRRTPVPLDHALTIMQGVADALHYAHALTDESGRPLGLVHRDVSLSNILVTYHGEPKLADFGIAKATEGEGTAGTSFKGKFAYAAPEQVAGRAVDCRTDVFALGIVFWELLTLKRLFKRSNDAATIKAVESADVAPVRSIRPEIPEELDRIVLRALRRDPGDRFQSAGEMSDALEELAASIGGGVQAKAMARWMRGLFGDELADIKKSISQGQGLSPTGELEHGLPTRSAELVGLKPIPEMLRRRHQPAAPARPAGPPAFEPKAPSVREPSARSTRQPARRTTSSPTSGSGQAQWNSAVKAAWSTEEFRRSANPIDEDRSRPLSTTGSEDGFGTSRSASGSFIGSASQSVSRSHLSPPMREPTSSGGSVTPAAPPPVTTSGTARPPVAALVATALVIIALSTALVVRIGRQGEAGSKTPERSPASAEHRPQE